MHYLLATCENQLFHFLPFLCKLTGFYVLKKLYDYCIQTWEQQWIILQWNIVLFLRMIFIWYVFGHTLWNAAGAEMLLSGWVTVMLLLLMLLSGWVTVMLQLLMLLLGWTIVSVSPTTSSSSCSSPTPSSTASTCPSRRCNISSVSGRWALHAGPLCLCWFHHRTSLENWQRFSETVLSKLLSFKFR